MTNRDVYIVSAVRTPVGKAPRGILSGVRPDELLAHVLRHAVDKKVDASRIEDVIIGCAMPEGEQGMNVARIGALMAGLPDNTSAMTINRFCSSGVQSIALAANEISSGRAELMVAGGTESMSMVPLGGNKMSLSPEVFEKDENVAIAYGMGITAEKVAQKWEVSREEQDAFAYESHQRALKAQSEGWLKDEIVPFEVTHRVPDVTTGKVVTQKVLVENDEGPRKDTSVEKLAKLRSVFAARGTVTAGNASQTSDGAGAVLLASEAMVKEYNLTPLAKFRSFAVAGVPPEIMGIGPIKAIPKALEQAGLTLEDMDWIELNEAFAAQSLAVMKELKLDHAKVNPVGGAIALGHPLGATGAIRAATLVHGLRRTKQKYGMITMCIGTGMGAAGIIEAL